MGTRDNAAFFFYVAVAILALSLGLASADGGATSAVSFGYSGPNGPQKWGSLSPKYQTCGSGKSQSPIDINKKNTVENKKLGKLAADYHSVEATLINSGHHVMIHFDECPGELEVEDKKYKMKQIHWHSPSEHTIDGQQYPLEVHMVHQADDGSMTVVAVLYEYGPEDKLLKKIKDEVEELAKDKCSEEEEAQVPLKKMEYKILKKSSHKYYRYTGSLTSPPCSENIIWSVLARAKTVSKEQVKALQEAVGEGYKVNARPVQALNGRKVELYKEHFR